MIGEGGDLALFTEPVSGFRTWRFSQDGVLTGATYVMPWWPLEKLRAECLPPNHACPSVKAAHTVKHQAPDLSCKCGFYAFDSYQQVQTANLMWGNVHFGVRGVAAGWGKVVVGEYGWRAEYARPVALLHWPERRINHRQPFTSAMQAEADRLNGLVRDVAARYRVPYVDTVEELEVIAAASGAKPALPEAEGVA